MNSGQLSLAIHFWAAAMITSNSSGSARCTSLVV